ncbi:MAG: hypothetical protein K8J09_05725, partial [Planctomycetes bacterium]|nr:hypothetical protein [Planctomycetota bacterium]
GLMPLAAALNPLRAKLYPHSVAVPVHVHQNLERQLRAQFAAAEALPAGVFPPDAVAAAVSVGVLPYHLRDLTFIDVHGLTDKTVAHTEVTVDDSRRRMAHDRIAKVDYLRQRGVNVDVEPVVQSRDAALAVADFALRIDDQNWLPLQVADRQWAQRAFPADRLAAAHHVDSQLAGANRLSLPAGTFVGNRLLATFELGDDGLEWQCRGDVGVRPNRLRVFGGCGERQLASEPGDEGADGAGSASSSPFTPANGVVASSCGCVAATRCCSRSGRWPGTACCHNSGRSTSGPGRRCTSNCTTPAPAGWCSTTCCWCGARATTAPCRHSQRRRRRSPRACR